MSKRDPRRYEFTVTEGPPTTDTVDVSLGIKDALRLLRCVADQLAVDDEAVSILFYGWLEDKGPR